jgi:hypothetical protein
MDRSFGINDPSSQIRQHGNGRLMRLIRGADAKDRPLICRHLPNNDLGNQDRRSFDFGYLGQSRLICSLDSQPLVNPIPRFRKCRAQSLYLKVAIIEPVGTPNTMKPPTEVFKHVLT